MTCRALPTSQSARSGALAPLTTRSCSSLVPTHPMLTLPPPTRRVYLKYHQLRISGNKAQLCERIREHIAKD